MGTAREQITKENNVFFRASDLSGDMPSSINFTKGGSISDELALPAWTTDSTSKDYSNENAYGIVMKLSDAEKNYVNGKYHGSVTWTMTDSI